MSQVRQSDTKTGKSKKNGKKKNTPKSVHQAVPDSFKKELLAAIRQARIVKAGSRIDQIKASDPNLLSVAVKRGDIPYWNARFAKGTQAPVIRLYLTNSFITASGAGVINSTYQLQAANFVNFSDLAAVFDEYRVLRGEFEVREAIRDSDAASSMIIAVVDYGDTTALASFAEGIAYDTKKYCRIAGQSVDVKAAVVKFPLKFEPLPDQEWTPSATSNLTFATWKSYSLSAVDASSTPLWITGWVDVQFRGSD